MKKLFAICSCLVLMFITCKKDDQIFEAPDSGSPDLISKARNWHNEQLNSISYDLTFKTSGIQNKQPKKTLLVPKWGMAKSQQWFRENNAVVVPTEAFILDNNDVGFLRFFIFLESKGRITRGRIIEVFGDSRFLSENKERLIKEHYLGKIDGFNGSIISYDVHYRPLGNRTYKDGIVEMQTQDWE